MVIGSPHIKAFILITVFSMNTVIGSACAMSDMFHQAHHHNNASSANHEHANGTIHSHDHDGAHHDQEESSDECCSRLSVEFNQLDKSLIQKTELCFLSYSFVLRTDPHITFSLSSRNYSSLFFQYERWRPPATIQDLRIVIQSFQI